MKPSLASAILLMALAACSPQAPATDGAKPAPAAEPAAPAVLDGPIAGKWRITRTVQGSTLPPEDICYETQTPLSKIQRVEEQPNIACSEEATNSTGGYAIHRVCTMEIMDKTYTLTTNIQATGDFRTRYALDTTVRSEPELMTGAGEQSIRSVAERLGDCDPK